MNTQSRKQREIAAREQLILDTASGLLSEVGYQAFTMDRLADATEYSKGTIYQHFCSKEDVLSCICLRCVHDLREMFQRAAEFDGQPRERMYAILMAYNLHSKMHPLEFRNMQIIKSEAVREKTSPANHAAMTEMEASIIGIVASVVTSGIEAGDLPPHPKMQPPDIVFATWSLAYGAMLLGDTTIPLNEYGISSIYNVLLETTNIMFDGLGWVPLSSEFDYRKTIERAGQEIFSEEIKQFNLTCPEPTPTTT